MNKEELKKQVGYKAAEFVQNNTIVGLGTGSTAKYLVEALGKRTKEENLNIVGVATSKRTEEQARSLGITIKNIDEVNHIDLTIDGADEISSDFQGIKGGGAAHFREKTVAINSEQNIWIVDNSKLSNNLGSFPLPLEVIPFGSSHVFNKLKLKNYNPKFRENNNKRIITDQGNYVIDLYLHDIKNPAKLAKELDSITGILEHGLFLNIVNKVIVGYPNGPKIINVR